MKKLTQEEFIQKARAVHGNKYDYSKVVYVNSRTPITIICPIHGEFQQIANNHLQGQGCRQCDLVWRKQFLTELRIQRSQKAKERLKTVESHKIPKDLTKDFIDKAKKIHGDKYNYDKTEYKHSLKKVTITCPIHGDFQQAPAYHLSGQGCRKCKYEQQALLQRGTKESFIEKAYKIHGDKYDYTKFEYPKNNKTTAIITCPIHGDFLQTPHEHLSGYGCPHCQHKAQDRLFQKLKGVYIEEELMYEATKKVIPWILDQRIDIYFPKYNIAIEYNGEHHYRPVSLFKGEQGLQETQKRDEIKRQKCRDNNCTLFELKYDYTDEDFETLIKNINNIIKTFKENEAKC